MKLNAKRISAWMAATLSLLGVQLFLSLWLTGKRFPYIISNGVGGFLACILSDILIALTIGGIIVIGLKLKATYENTEDYVTIAWRVVAYIAAALLIFPTGSIAIGFASISQSIDLVTIMRWADGILFLLSVLYGGALLWDFLDYRKFRQSIKEDGGEDITFPEFIALSLSYDASEEEDE